MGCLAHKKNRPGNIQYLPTANDPPHISLPEEERSELLFNTHFNLYSPLDTVGTARCKATMQQFMHFFWYISIWLVKYDDTASGLTPAFW